MCVCIYVGFPDSSVGKESTCNAGDPNSISGSGRSPGEGIDYPLKNSWASLLAPSIKNPPAMHESWVRSLVGKIPWRRAEQPTLVFLPGESPWTEKPGRLQFMGSQTVRHIGCLLAMAGQYKPPTGFCHKLYEVTTEPQSRAPHLLDAGCFIHSRKHTVELVKCSRKRVC